MGATASTQTHSSPDKASTSSKALPESVSTSTPTRFFETKSDKPPFPSNDVFNYVFNIGRRPYPWNRVIYRVGGSDESLTLAQLEEKSRRFAVALHKHFEIKANDVISIFAKDKIQYPIAFFGALAAGATIDLIPYQNGMSVEDVGARLEEPRAKLLITDAALLRIAEASSVLAGCVPIMTLDKADEHTVNLDELLSSAPADQSIFELTSHDEAENQNAFIDHTGSSADALKSVLISHSHYIAALEGIVRSIPSNTDPSHDIWLASSSLGFFSNAKLFMSLNILLGIPVIIMPEALDEASISVIERHSITFFPVSPPMVFKLAEVSLNPTDVKTTKWLLSTEATMSEDLRHALSKKTLNVNITSQWSTNETMLIAMQTDDPKSRLRGSSGILINGMQARVISTESGADLGPNECGELLVRNVLARFQGYRDDEVANRDFDAEGWFQTGEYGYIDDGCNVFIVERLKEQLQVVDGFMYL